MCVTQLQDSALFAVATALFKVEVRKYAVVHSWELITSNVLRLVPSMYPYLPKIIEKNIIQTISIIGSEVSCMEKTLKGLKLSTDAVLEPLSFSKICWTPYFTIDRLKTICNLSTECVTIDNITYPTWIEKYWLSCNEIDRSSINRNFGKFSLFVFFHWFCYNPHHFCFMSNPLMTRLGSGSIPDSLIYFHFAQNRDFYLDTTVIENVFRYSVIMCDICSVSRFFSMLPVEVRDKNVFAMATLLINRCDSVGHHATCKKEIVLTFLYLWKNLSLSNKMNIVQTHFRIFFEFLLSFPGTDPLVYSLNWYRPSNSKKINRSFLEKAAAEISPDCLECEKHRKVFHLLFCKVEMTLCEIDVVSLLEKLLSVKDITSSVLMMKTMSASKKKRVLDISQKIWQDLWKESVDVDTFMTFFVEVQSDLIQEDALICDYK